MAAGKILIKELFLAPPQLCRYAATFTSKEAVNFGRSLQMALLGSLDFCLKLHLLNQIVKCHHFLALLWAGRQTHWIAQAEVCNILVAELLCIPQYKSASRFSNYMVSSASTSSLASGDLMPRFSPSSMPDTQMY